MDIDDAIVETSDQEELEELAAATSQYWQVNTRDMARRRGTVHRATPQTEVDDFARHRSSAFLLAERRQTKKCGSPPRKRRKVDTTSNSAPSTPLVPRTNLHNASPSPHTSPTSYIPESGYGGPSSSPTSYIIPSPARSTQTQNGVLIMKDHNVDGPLSVGRESEEDTGGEAMPPQRQASTGSPSLSPDPLLLFTPRRRSVSPRSERAIISPHTFSPITPISSPSKSTQGHVTPPQPSPPHPAPLPSPHMSPHTLHAIQQAQEAELARYSLRTRKAQQLKPYEYDKLLYKRQMRSNPDALVKVVSPPRPTRRQRSKSAQPRDGSDAEDEYLAREDDEDDEEAKEARQRRKGKQREIAGGGEAHGGELDGERATPWIPDVFDESSSSSSDDGEDIVADLNAAKRREEKERRRAEKKRRQEEKERRRKKLKPFPLKKPDLQWSVSSLGEASESPSPAKVNPPLPRPRPRPRQRMEERAMNIDGDEKEPLPTWHRRRSVTFSSPDRNSPPPNGPKDDDLQLVHTDKDQEFVAPWNNYDSQFYEDEFARGQSPLKFFATQDDNMSGTSSEVHDPPPTSSELNEIIDLTSGSELDRTDSSPSRGRSRPRGSSSPSSSSESVDDRDRERFKALSRMMPMVMIKQLQKQNGRRKNAAAARASASVERDIGGHNEGRPLRPGETRKRIRTVSSRSVEIRGDSESSDVDMLGASPQPEENAEMSRLTALSDTDSDDVGLSSSEESVIEPIGHQPRPKYHPSTTNRDDGGDGDSSSSEDERSSGEDASAGNPPRPRPRRSRFRYDGEAEVDNRIDRMLMRTNFEDPAAKRKNRRRKGKRSAGGGGGVRHRERGSGHRHEGRVGGGGHGGGGDRIGGGHKNTGTGGGNRLRITTSGAKRYGSGRQTTLPFKPVVAGEVDDEVEIIDALPALPNELQFTGDEPARVKQKAAKLKAKPPGFYTFNVGGTHHTGGRAKAEYVTIDQEVSAPRGPARLSVGGARSSKLMPKSHRESKQLHLPTLHKFWNKTYQDDGSTIPDIDQRGRLKARDNPEVEQLSRVSIELGVEPLPAGVAFPSTTYLGHSWLHELINLLPGTHPPHAPPSCTMFDCYLHPDMSVADFTPYLESISDMLRNLILGGDSSITHETCHQWQGFLHAVSQHLSWLLLRAQEAEHLTLTTEMDSFVRRLVSLTEEPVEILPEDETPNPLVLQILWFHIETATRLALDRKRRLEEPDRVAVAEALKGLVVKLWDYTFGIWAISLDLSREALTPPSISQQIAELWVCSLNLANDMSFQTGLLPETVTFWSTYLQVIKSKVLDAPQVGIRAQESLWRSVFSLCALSQFSIHGNSSMTPRIPPSWPTIVAILEPAPLACIEDPDPSNSAQTTSKTMRDFLRRLDKYARVLVCRCLFLNLKWHWRLDADGAPRVFNRLIDVFKSRKFASLKDEQSDFPSFLRHNDIALLQEKKSSDTAFTMFLKLVVRAAEDMCKNNPRFAQSEAIPPGLKQILSLAVPLSSFPFTKERPPIDHQRSMLYNRFSAIAVAIYLEPTEVNVKYRISTARRYVKFEDTDDETRRACIRGAMHLAIVLRHLALPLTDVLDWLKDITNILIDEYQASDASKIPSHTPRVKDKVVMLITLLLGSVRLILETPSMDPGADEHKYPDPALLEGPWVTRVFSNATNLSTLSSTGDEIRRLVQVFLKARNRAMPRPRRARPTPKAAKQATDDSQDSQMYWDDDELNIHDLELGGVDEVTSVENKKKDAVVCNIIHEHIGQAIYRLVCKHFNDPVYQQRGELSFENADRWIDCWVGCNNVLVQSGKRDWDFFFDFGPQSYDKIIESDWKRRVGLRFNYMVLQLDPDAYKKHTGRFINSLFESMAVPHVTIEHDYASLLFSIDDLRHPLLRDLPIDDPDPEGDGDYHLKKSDFHEKRLAMIEAMFRNLSNNLLAAANGNQSLHADNGVYLGSVERFFVTTKDIFESLSPKPHARASYVTFCNQISDLTSRYPAINTHSRLAGLLTSLRSVS